MKHVALIVVFALAACQSREARQDTFHVELGSAEDPRGRAYEIGRSAAVSAPLLLYDSQRKLLNISLGDDAGAAKLRRALGGSASALRAGLNNAPAEFVQQMECQNQRRCTVEEDTVCTFVMTTSNEHYDRHFDDFAQFVIYSGHPALGVFYQADHDGVSIRVPFYRDCDNGRNDLTAAWRRYARGSETEFHLQVDGRATPSPS